MAVMTRVVATPVVADVARLVSAGSITAGAYH